MIPGQSMWNLWRTMWQADRLFSEHSGFPLSLSSHQCSILTFIYTLLLQEGQMGEAWEPSRKQSSFGKRGALEGERCHLKEQNGRELTRLIRIRTGTNGRLLSTQYRIFWLHKIRKIPSTAEEQWSYPEGIWCLHKRWQNFQTEQNTWADPAPFPINTLGWFPGWKFPGMRIWLTFIQFLG